MASQTYSKTQLDTALAGKADKATVDQNATAISKNTALVTGYQAQTLTGATTIAVTAGTYDLTVSADSALTLSAANGTPVTLLVRPASGKTLTIQGTNTVGGTAGTTAISATGMVTLLKTSDGWVVGGSSAATGSTGSSGSTTTPPVWPAGITATTGTPTATSVVVAFSADLPAGTLQVRYGDTDSWRTVTASGRNVTLSGLTALTRYAAPQFQVITQAGATDPLTAQAFTTAAPPKKWTLVGKSTFTAADGTDITTLTPELGNKLVVGQGVMAVSANAAHPVWDGKTRYSSGFSQANGEAIRKLRATASFGGLDASSMDFGLIFITPAATYGFKVGYNMGGAFGISAGDSTVTFGAETTGASLPQNAPASGTLIVEIDDTTITASTPSGLIGVWPVTWPAKATSISVVGTTIGSRYGVGMDATNTISPVFIDDFKVEVWK